jgi:hypothetical protein
MISRGNTVNLCKFAAASGAKPAIAAGPVNRVMRRPQLRRDRPRPLTGRRAAPIFPARSEPVAQPVEQLTFNQ